MNFTSDKGILSTPPGGKERSIVIQADRLTKRFGDFTAVDQISFEVNRGEIFGFLGANGAGKDHGNAYALRIVVAHFWNREGCGL